MTQLNPMSSVNVAELEDKMRTASLDQHRGYSQSHYPEVQQYRPTETIPKSAACGHQVLREPVWNKGMFNPPHPPVLFLASHLSNTFTQFLFSFFFPLLVSPSFLSLPPPPHRTCVYN